MQILESRPLAHPPKAPKDEPNITSNYRKGSTELAHIYVFHTCDPNEEQQIEQTLNKFLGKMGGNTLIPTKEDREFLTTRKQTPDEKPRGCPQRKNQKNKWPQSQKIASF